MMLLNFPPGAKYTKDRTYKRSGGFSCKYTLSYTKDYKDVLQHAKDPVCSLGVKVIHGPQSNLSMQLGRSQHLFHESCL